MEYDLSSGTSKTVLKTLINKDPFALTYQINTDFPEPLGNNMEVVGLASGDGRVSSGTDGDAEWPGGS